MEEKILNYLANGLAASQVATLVGASPGYISQLMSKEDFKARLKARILDNPVTVDDKLEDKYSAVEHALVNAIQDAIPGSELPAISRALETVARIRHERFSRKNPVATQQVTMNVVQLTIPSHVLRQDPVIYMNSKAEILSIDNEPMAPLSSEGVKNLFANIKAARAALPIEL